jgi:hypothetical protein
VITDVKSQGQQVDMGPAIEKTLTTVTELDVTNAITITGTKKMQFVNGTGQGTLYVIDGNEIQYGHPITYGVRDLDITTDIHTNSDVFDEYKIIVKSADSASAKVVLAESAQIFTVNNDQTGVAGYYKAKLNDTAFAGGYGEGRIILLGDPMTLPKDETIDLPDLLHTVKYSIEKKVDLKRKKSVSVASGTKLKETFADYDPFLEQDITVSAIAVVPGVGPTLDIVDEATADKDMNLVLIGGPVANTLTAELVTNGKSTVDWYASEGDIEVISSAFKTTKYAIIVAGKNREATKAAADALAAAL